MSAETALRPRRIAIDAMGGDSGPDVTVAAALAASRPDLQFILVGQEDVLRARLGTRADDSAVSVRHAPQVVGMDESPQQALRTKKESSMRVAINLVKQGEADACVSAGNTGALMATARFVLKMLPGIDRPAICTSIPSIHGHVHMLDLGANVDSKAEHLMQFAIMGSVLASVVDGQSQPRVALLNIGEEDIKGNEQVRAAAALLVDGPLNYVGFIEGDGIFLDPVDVVVCDGFVGNVALKTSEGVAKLVRHYMRQEFQRSAGSKLAALVARPALRRFADIIDPRRYNGASLLGLQGIVIKSHGGADELAFINALNIAALEADKGVPALIAERLSDDKNAAQQAL